MTETHDTRLRWCEQCHVAFRVFRGENKCPMCEKVSSKFLNIEKKKTNVRKNKKT